ncbi:alpha/beta fold hydrolase [Sphingomonas baiyangensis]|uniref:Alpha/beta hydrolase n=1 Tax=Sphingomonas baiyangensis TaxID=2572576 RepID=A0A4U1L5Q9_9SPHN|nr:alpha/beta hydrolase [Sphingomonas baiyangensis]TKD51565.1 alpha/beta hydrolase [Sphingomonas baiyangensis]
MDDGAADLPLARFEGAPPPRSPWLADTLAMSPERTRFACEGAGIELLTWGEAGKPGLLFLHGNGAHADWWSFIAPAFAASHRCAAISWSGMGGSDWRDGYSIEGYARELLGTIDAAGLDQAGPPIVVGHSFGGIPLMYAAVHHGNRIGGGIMVDSFVPPRERPAPDWAVSGKAPPRYASEAAIVARYRFAPPQDSAHPDIVDHLARGSVRVAADGSGEWMWRFDPRMWATLDRSGADPLVERAGVPFGILHGELSALVSADHAERLAARLPDCRFVAAIPRARHHIMVDEPIALIAALRVGIATLEHRT